MKAMLLHAVTDLQENHRPLIYTEIVDEAPGMREILIKVSACGVCHTELDEIEGRTPPPRFPVVPGHQVIGRVVALGESAHRFASEIASVLPGYSTRAGHANSVTQATRISVRNSRRPGAT